MSMDLMIPVRLPVARTPWLRPRLPNVTLGKVGTSFFNGGILDDVRIYSGDLKESGSDLEVTAIYSGGYGDFNKIRIVGTGSTDITANQPGSTSYAPALPLPRPLRWLSRIKRSPSIHSLQNQWVISILIRVLWPVLLCRSVTQVQILQSLRIVGVDGPDLDYLLIPVLKKFVFVKLER